MEIATIIWLILSFISTIVLIYAFAVGKNSIWGGFTVGIFIGLIIALKFYYQNMEFDGLILAKGAVIGSLAGTVFSFFKRK